MKPKLKRPLSLSLRVMLFVMLAIGLSLLLISRLVLSTVERHFIEQDADELRVMVDSIEHALAHDDGDFVSMPASLSSAISGHHDVFYEVKDGAGAILFSSAGLDFTSALPSVSPAATVNAENLELWAIDSKTYRGVVVASSIAGVSYQITSAIDMEFHMEFLDSFRQSLWLIILGAGVLTLLAAWVGVYQGLRPLRGVSHRVRTIQTNKLDTRLDPIAVPIELQDLVLSFNQMIEQLEVGFSKLSHFSDDIAHELRTPLTNMITQTQVGLSKARSDADYRELLYSVLEEQERLNKMVNDMLWLAKSENGLIKLSSTPINLQDEFQALFEFFDAFADERGVTLAVNPKSVLVRGDRDLLRRAFTNLLSNAIYHSPKNAVVNVILAQDEDYACITVENNGPVIVPKHLTRIFDRFYRIDPSRARNSEGAGLGLAIVKSVIEAHDGNVQVESSTALTRFTARLPKVKNGASRPMGPDKRTSFSLLS